jgi:hypothetical protein
MFIEIKLSLVEVAHQYVASEDSMVFDSTHKIPAGHNTAQY